MILMHVSHVGLLAYSEKFFRPQPSSLFSPPASARLFLRVADLAASFLFISRRPLAVRSNFHPCAQQGSPEEHLLI